MDAGLFQVFITAIPPLPGRVGQSLASPRSSVWHSPSHSNYMMIKTAALSLAAVLVSSSSANFKGLVDRQAPATAPSSNPGIPYIRICPNPDYEGLNDTVTCLDITNLTAPRSYGQVKTCSELISWASSEVKPLTWTAPCFSPHQFH